MSLIKLKILVLLAFFAFAGNVQAQIADIDLGEVATGLVKPLKLTARNENCLAPQDFRIKLSSEPWFRLSGPTVLSNIPAGDSQSSELLLDFSNLSPGRYKGSLAINCESCGWWIFTSCTANDQKVNIEFRIPRPATRNPGNYDSFLDAVNDIIAGNVNIPLGPPIWLVGDSVPGNEIPVSGELFDDDPNDADGPKGREPVDDDPNDADGPEGREPERGEPFGSATTQDTSAGYREAFFDYDGNPIDANGNLIGVEPNSGAPSGGSLVPVQDPRTGAFIKVNPGLIQGEPISEQAVVPLKNGVIWFPFNGSSLNTTEELPYLLTPIGGGENYPRDAELGGFVWEEWHPSYLDQFPIGSKFIYSNADADDSNDSDVAVRRYLEFLDRLDRIEIGGLEENPDEPLFQPDERPLEIEPDENVAPPPKGREWVIEPGKMFDDKKPKRKLHSKVTDTGLPKSSVVIFHTPFEFEKNMRGQDLKNLRNTRLKCIKKTASVASSNSNFTDKVSKTSTCLAKLRVLKTALTNAKDEQVVAEAAMTAANLKALKKASRNASKTARTAAKKTKAAQQAYDKQRAICMPLVKSTKTAGKQLTNARAALEICQSKLISVEAAAPHQAIANLQDKLSKAKTRKAGCLMDIDQYAWQLGKSFKALRHLNALRPRKKSSKREKILTDEDEVYFTLYATGTPKPTNVTAADVFNVLDVLKEKYRIYDIKNSSLMPSSSRYERSELSTWLTDERNITDDPQDGEAVIKIMEEIVTRKGRTDHIRKNLQRMETQCNNNNEDIERIQDKIGGTAK